MAHPMKALRGWRVAAKDGPAGVLNELYFDDRGWAARYLAIDNGDRRPGRRLLPAASASLDEGAGAIVLRLTREQVKRGIAIDTNPHLFSGRELSGYRIQAHDGPVGQVEDLLVGDDWSISAVVVTVRDWLLPGRQVELARADVEALDRAKRMLHVRLRAT